MKDITKETKKYQTITQNSTNQGSKKEPKVSDASCFTLLPSYLYDIFNVYPVSTTVRCHWYIHEESIHSEETIYIANYLTECLLQIDMTCIGGH